MQHGKDQLLYVASHCVLLEQSPTTVVQEEDLESDSDNLHAIKWAKLHKTLAILFGSYY